MSILNQVLSRISNFIWIIVLLLAGYAMYDSYVVYNHATDTGILKYKPVLTKDEEVQERAVIPGSIAWLTLDNTTVDFPIMQGDDNSEYLNKDPLGKFSLAGSIFLDYRNNPDFSDNYNLVYGHHLERGAMFGALDLFKENDFFDTHQTGSIIIDNNQYKIKIFAVSTCFISDEEVFNPSGNIDELKNFINKNSMFINDSNMPENFSNARIIALTTCASSPSDARLAVFGEIIQ